MTDGDPRGLSITEPPIIITTTSTSQASLSLEELGLVEVTTDDEDDGVLVGLRPNFENVISSSTHHRGDDGATELHFAVATGNVEVVEEILQRMSTSSSACTSPISSSARSFIESSRTKDDRTVLHVAASLNKESIVRMLLRYDADVNAKAKYGLTPLHFAATKGHASMVALLLEVGADPWSTLSPPQKEHTPLHLAAINGRFDAFVALFGWMKKEHSSESVDGLLPTEQKTKKKKKKFALMSLKKKKKQSKDDNDLGENDDLLREGDKKQQKGKREKKMKRLVDLRTAAEGTTLLHCAVVGCDLANDGDVDTEDNGGRGDPQQKREGPRIVKYLLEEQGADPLLTSKNGWTALHLAAALGSTDACKALLQEGEGRSTSSDQVTSVSHGSKQQEALLTKRASFKKQKKLRASDIARLQCHLELAAYLKERESKKLVKKKPNKGVERSLSYLEERPD